jgi:hypothetical protein
VLEPAHDLLRAQIANLRGDHLAAVRVVDVVLLGDADLPPIISTQLQIERLWGLLGVGSDRLTEKEMESLVARAGDLMDIDDVACLYRLLELAAEKIPQCNQVAAEYGVLARRYAVELAEWRASIGRELDLVIPHHLIPGEERR